MRHYRKFQSTYCNVSLVKFYLPCCKKRKIISSKVCDSFSWNACAKWSDLLCILNTFNAKCIFLVLSRWLKSYRNMIHPKIPFAQSSVCGTVHLCLRVIRYDFYSVEEAAMRKELVSWEFASIMFNITRLFILKVCILYLIGK